MYEVKVGAVQIHRLIDARVWVDAGGAFGVVPRLLWTRVLTPDAENRIPMDLACLLVRAGGKTILIETGIGDKLTPRQLSHWGASRPGGLVGELAKLDVAPADVDIVILTHLHADHCGGNTTMRGGKLCPTFPNAEYWVQRLEYADASFPNERTRATYLPENFKPLEAAGQLRLLSGDTPVVEGLRCVVTRGHTRSHQALVFESGGAHALFTGDMASLAANFERLAWVTAYDVEPLETIESKRRWQEWALTHDALIFCGHETERPVGRLRCRENGKLWLEPVLPDTEM